jgi:lipopolysaccharide/colanic/teichoic acid biosynthesis glycosyltransferase
MRHRRQARPEVHLLSAPETTVPPLQLGQARLYQPRPRLLADLVIVAGLALAFLAPGRLPFGPATGLALAPALAGALLARLCLGRRPGRQGPARIVRAAFWLAMGIGAAAGLQVLEGEVGPSAPAIATGLLLGLGWLGLADGPLLAAVADGARRHGDRTLVIVGAGEQGRHFLQHVRRPGCGFRLIGIFDDRATRVPEWIEGYPVLGRVDEVVRFVAENAIDDVVVALPWQAGERIMSCLAALRPVTAAVYLCPDFAGYRLADRPVIRVAGVPLVEVQAVPPSGRRLIKAAQDRLLATALLLFCLPLLLILGLLVAIEQRGRVLARETVRGFDGRPMQLTAFVTRGPEGEARALGGLLERSGLSLLPRLWDVAVGRIGLVGPQPHGRSTPPLVARRVDEALARYRAKPGLIPPTVLEDGPEAATPLERRLVLDQAYLEGWSPWLDLRILLRALT